VHPLFLGVADQSAGDSSALSFSLLSAESIFSGKTGLACHSNIVTYHAG
jgi:hypothetical protein